jgi:hypothetical protein
MRLPAYPPYETESVIITLTEYWSPPTRGRGYTVDISLIWVSIVYA